VPRFQGPAARAAGHQQDGAPLCSVLEDQSCRQRPSHTAEGPRPSGLAPGRQGGNRALAAETTAGWGIGSARPAWEGGLEERSSHRREQRRARGPCPAGYPRSLAPRPIELPERAGGHRRAAGKPPPEAPRPLERADAGQGPPGHSSQARPPQASPEAFHLPAGAWRRPRHDQRGCELHRPRPEGGPAAAPPSRREDLPCSSISPCGGRPAGQRPQP